MAVNGWRGILNQIVFCLYAEDAGLLRDNLFSDIVRRQYRNPDMFNLAVSNLFDQMARGGLFGADAIAHFNGDSVQRIGDGGVERGFAATAGGGG